MARTDIEIESQNTGNVGGGLKDRIGELFPRPRQEMGPGINVKSVRDDGSDVEALLGQISDGGLAWRIMDAARLAITQHMVQKADSMRSAVEAEDSTL